MKVADVYFELKSGSFRNLGSNGGAGSVFWYRTLRRYSLRLDLRSAMFAEIGSRMIQVKSLSLVNVS